MYINVFSGKDEMCPRSDLVLKFILLFHKNSNFVYFLKTKNYIGCFSKNKNNSLNTKKTTNFYNNLTMRNVLSWRHLAKKH